MPEILNADVHVFSERSNLGKCNTIRVGLKTYTCQQRAQKTEGYIYYSFKKLLLPLKNKVQHFFGLLSFCRLLYEVYTVSVLDSPLLPKIIPFPCSTLFKGGFTSNPFPQNQTRSHFLQANSPRYMCRGAQHTSFSPCFSSNSRTLHKLN